jgi:hypothetical protein
MMNTTAAIRQELHAYIDVIPDRNLYALKPILSILAEPAYILETNLTDGEREIIAEGDKEFEEHPENFVTLDSILFSRRNKALAFDAPVFEFFRQQVHVRGDADEGAFRG